MYVCIYEHLHMSVSWSASMHLLMHMDTFNISMRTETTRRPLLQRHMHMWVVL